VVRAVDFSDVGGTPTTFYRDNVTPESPDTGDPGSYGDAGVAIADLTKATFFVLNWNYILQGNQPNVGAAYNSYARNPLQVTATQTQPFTMSQVTIARSAADIVLSWAPVSEADFYRTWVSSQPYFAPTGTPAPDLDNNPLTFTHTGAAANLTNYYYVVRAVDTVGSDNFESAISNRTGKFAFELVRGTG
jgi:hypothetical protein